MTAANPADCSLREAVVSANTSGGADTIVLPAGTYSLTIAAQFADNNFAQVGDLDVHGDVSIVGRDGAATINGNGTAIRDRVFDIHEANVSMRGLSITNGRAKRTEDANGDGTLDFARGGGVRVGQSASLNLTDATVQNNTAESFGEGGAIYNAGEVGLVDVNISGNEAVGGFSGGLHTAAGATTRLFDTTISNNEADFGGGLGAYGVTLVERSTIDGNEANLGGGIRAAAGNSITSLTNVTLSDNNALGNGAAIQARNGIGLTLSNVTIARNTSDSDGDGTGGAAVFLDRDDLPTKATLRNTILAANEDGSPGSSDIPDCGVVDGAEISLAGYNLIGNRNGCVLTEPPGAEGNQIGGAANPINPLFATNNLAPNGGPTPTLALLSNSPAIDVGSPASPGSSGACAPSDQRGAPRSDCDIGAYELVRCLGAVTNVVGANGPDDLRGGAGNDAILALGGDDRIFGGGGNDAVCGGEGNDTAHGESGGDTVSGGVGNDTLLGGDGIDRMFADTGVDSLSGHGGRDILDVRDNRGSDFAHGGPDTDRCFSDSGDRRISCP